MWEVLGEFAALPAGTTPMMCLVALYVARGEDSVLDFAVVLWCIAGTCWPSFCYPGYSLVVVLWHVSYLSLKATLHFLYKKTVFSLSQLDLILFQERGDVLQ